VDHQDLEEKLEKGVDPDLQDQVDHVDLLVNQVQLDPLAQLEVLVL